MQEPSEVFSVFTVQWVTDLMAEQVTLVGEGAGALDPGSDLQIRLGIDQMAVQKLPFSDNAANFLPEKCAWVGNTTQRTLGPHSYADTSLAGVNWHRLSPSCVIHLLFMCRLSRCGTGLLMCSLVLNSTLPQSTCGPLDAYLQVR